MISVVGVRRADQALLREIRHLDRSGAVGGARLHTRGLHATAQVRSPTCAALLQDVPTQGLLAAHIVPQVNRLSARGALDGLVAGVRME